jgi:O-antigen/teichoic acid export membrane protein
LIGNYQIAVTFAVIITFFTTPVASVLFPAFAKVDLQKEQQILETVLESSIKYASLILVPATMAIMIVSGSAVSTLFGDKWVYAPFFLTLYVVNNLFVGLGRLSIDSFLVGVGETKMLMKQSLLAVILGIPLAFLLVRSRSIRNTHIRERAS